MSNDRFTLEAIDSFVEMGLKLDFKDPIVLKEDGIVAIKDEWKIIMVMSEAAWEKFIIIRHGSSK